MAISNPTFLLTFSGYNLRLTGKRGYSHGAASADGQAKFFGDGQAAKLCDVQQKSRTRNESQGWDGK
jgi:hypothetical protein